MLDAESDENENDLNFGEDPIDKINKWKQSKNIVDKKKNVPRDSPRDNQAFSPWTDNEDKKK